MRARRREINIFNMSLLDILCGALGAFCFMMLVALPYYIPPGSGLELRKAQEETDRLLLAIGNLKERMPDQKSIEEMEALMRQLEAQVKALQGRVNMLTAEREEMQTKMNRLATEKEQLRTQAEQLMAEKGQLQEQVNQLIAEKALVQDANQQLTKKNENLTQANERLASLLAQKKPFAVVSNASDISQMIDVLVTPELAEVKADSGPNEGFQRWLEGRAPLAPMHFLLSSPGHAMEIKSDVPKGTQYKTYLRLGNAPISQRTTEIGSAILEMMQPHLPTRLPTVKLSPARPWTLLGTITFDGENHPIFKESTAEERDAEWTALTSGTPPPTATPAPPPTAEEQAAAIAARERRRELAKKFTRLHQLHPEVESDEAEILALTDELLKTLPRGDMMRRQAETTRERTLASKSRRQAQPSPTPITSATP